MARGATSTAALVEALGGARALGRVRTAADLRAKLRGGLPHASLGRDDVAGALRLPARTWARRRKTQRLDADESDRLVRLARLATAASQVLGGEAKAAAWLRRPNRALGGDPPLALVDTDPGTQEVLDVLGRLAHGVVG
jgi:putative toxin-antitoxin system antitoxin component (TIGR02293 family)